MPSEHLPRLLYWADLPVNNNSAAGAVFMHRLLEAYPAGKLLICAPRAPAPDSLPGVKTIEPPAAPLEFLFRSRFAYEWATVLRLWGMLVRAALRGKPPRWMASAVKDFAPEAVLTVGISGAWMGADALSRHLNIPLHLIVHDDHHYAVHWIPSLRAWGERLFGKTYRRASSRLCISEPMEREYRRRFGVSGQVLQPSRARDSVWFDAPRALASQPLSSAKVFYAGSIYGSTFAKLECIAEALAARGHRLVVYTLSKPPTNFRPTHLEVRAPLLSSAELVKQLYEEADILLLFANFDQRDRETLRTLFPSKMADYTAAAVPILVVAPEDACITAYLKGRPLAGDLLSDDTPVLVAEAVDRLAASSTRRRQLAEGAIEAGKEDFSYERAVACFCSQMVLGYDC